MPVYKAYFRKNTRKKMTVEADSEIEAVIIAANAFGAKLDSDIILIQPRKLTCPKCSYLWTFSGFRKLYATCPQCMKQILISQASK